MRVNRRWLLALTGTTLTGALAGCSDTEEPHTHDNDNGDADAVPSSDDNGDVETGGDDDNGEDESDSDEPREITGNENFDVDYRVTTEPNCELTTERAHTAYASDDQTFMFTKGFNGTDCDELRVVNGEIDGPAFVIDAELLPVDDSEECDEECERGQRLDIHITFLQEVPTGFEFYLTTEENGRERVEGGLI